MASRTAVLSVLFLLAVSVDSQEDSICQDIDSSACVLMAASKPDFCSNAVLAETACPRYCNLCPVECYHCNTTVNDYHMCNTTKLCEHSELCMRKQLKSSMDGHIEYELTCETKQVCDGIGLHLSFGKRNLGSRDLSISCCSTDRCNYPAEMTSPPPTTMMTNAPAGCKKDVLLIVDESHHLDHYASAIASFLSSVVLNLPIGPNDVLMSMATFSDRAHTQWNLNDHTTENSLIQALKGLHLRGGIGDLNVAINFAIGQVNSHYGGNRADAPDVVIIITDDDAESHFKEQMLEHQLHAKTDNVIAIGVGHHVSSADIGHLASDGHHDFVVPSPQQLSLLHSSVAQLICSN